MLSIQKDSSKNKKYKFFIAALVLFLGFVLLFAAIWSKRTFGNVPFEQVLFHLRVPIEGTNKSTIFSFLFFCIPLAFFGTTILLSMTKRWFATTSNLVIRIKQKTIALRFSFLRVMRRFVLLFPILVFIVCTVMAAIIVKLPDYLKTQSVNSNLFEDYYVDPRNVRLNFPQEKRNLIYIFVESMEGSYASIDSGGGKPINLIPELTTLAENNVNFSSSEKMGGMYYELPGMDWTIAGMVAQTSGIPLKSPVNVNIEGNDYGKYSKFLKGAYSIGEILENEGYNQMIMVGSKMEFAGRDKYFSQHGNYTLWDYNTAIEQGKIEKGYDIGWWGFEDVKLFEYAKEEITNLAQKKEPFNFTMLTVDTHFYTGYLCDYCESKYDEQYENVIACASKQVGRFLEWLQTQFFYENTTIIITGDHKAMREDFFEDIPETYERNIYNVFINSAVSPKKMKGRSFTSVDIFPSTLAALGVEIEGNQLGLGVNLFSEKETLPEAMGMNYFLDQLKLNSKYYNNQLLYGG